MRVPRGVPRGPYRCCDPGWVTSCCCSTWVRQERGRGVNTGFGLTHEHVRQGLWPSTALSDPDQPQLISLGPLVPAPAAPPWFRSPPPPGTARSGTSKEDPWPNPALAAPLGGIRYPALRQPRGGRTGRGHEDPAGTSRPLCQAPFPANPRLRGVLLLPCEGALGEGTRPVPGDAGCSPTPERSPELRESSARSGAGRRAGRPQPAQLVV